MKAFFFSVVCSILLFFTITGGFAQGPPIITDTPIMLGLEGGAIRTFGKYFSRDNTKMYVQPLAIPYNINAHWQVGTVVPFVWVNPEGISSRSGVGDVMVFSKYQVMQKDGKGKTFRSLLKLTHTFSTGSTDRMPPLGMGTSQTTAGLVSGYVSTRYGIYTEAAYNFRAGGLPDEVIYNVAFGIPLLPQQYPPKQINIYLEFNGNLTLENEISNLFISPGVQWIAGRKLLIEAGIQLPLHEDVAEKTNIVASLGTRILLF